METMPDKYQQALLIGLAHDLKLPFLQLQNQLELLQQSDPRLAGNLDSLESSVQYGLQLLDSYALALELQKNGRQMLLEPYGTGAVLQDAAQLLDSYAKQYQTQIQIDNTAIARPVMLHRQSFTAALYCLGMSLIRAQISQGIKTKDRIIVIGAHDLHGGRLAAGVFGSAEGINKAALRTARHLQGLARQPLQSIGAGSASGIFVAEQLIKAMHDRLHAAHHNNRPGLAAHLIISHQTQLF